MNRKIKVLFLTMLVIGIGSTVLAQEISTPGSSQSEFGSAGEVSSTSENNIIIRFKGREIADDWAALAETLIDQELAPEHLEIPVEPNDSLCKIYVKELNLPGCSKKVEELAKQLNSDIKLPGPFPGDMLKVPNLPLTTFTWGRSFDKSLPEDALEYEDFIKRWEGYKIEEKERFSHTQVFIYGWQLELPEAYQKETSFEITEQSLEDLKSEGVPANVLDLLEGIKNQEFREEKEFLDALTTTIGNEQTVRYKSTILKHSQKDFVPILDTWEMLDIPDANVILPSKAAPVSLYSVPTQSADKYFKDCQQKQASAELRGSYYMMLGVPDPKECSCQGSECPQIVLVDTDVYKHPDIKDAIVHGGKNGNDDVQADPTGVHCPTIGFDRDKHHGTHMAGIMVSRIRNGSHFVGLAQNAELCSYKWQKDFIEIEKLITKRMDSEHPTVFVFASEFSYDQVGNDVMTEEGFLINKEVRLDHPSPAKTIRDSRLLWITAVGQADREPVLDIGMRIPKSPMNIGDQRNVIVVTACEQCTGSNAELWDKAHYSTDGLVHVAAPGGKMIPSTATNSRYAEINGTSQATAYVGGLAAQMMACYPIYRSKPRFLKERLQVTARPFLLRKDAERVTGGIVDPEKALLDPKAHWLTEVGVERKKLASIKWVPDRIFLTDADSNGRIEVGYTNTEKIRRILKTKPSAGGNDQWIIFKKIGLGKIERIGPGTLHKDKEIVQVTLSNGREKLLKLSDIQDLLVKITSD